MKNLLTGVFALLLAGPVFAANNIKMVTYFPVPYVAYGTLGVDGTCDAGVLGSCDIDAGSSLKVFKKSSDSRALNTGSLILRGGRLDLNAPSGKRVNGNKLTAGSGTGLGVLEFAHDLAVETVNSSQMQSLQAQNKAWLSSLSMFGHTFPACTEEGNEISWQKLTINGGEGVFLVCGKGAVREQDCTENPNQEKCCTNLEEWNGTSCEKKTCPANYTLNEVTGECEKKKYTCYVSHYAKTIDLDTPGRVVPDGAHIDNAIWRLTSYATTMVCGDETVHHGGTVSDLKKGQANDCEAGKDYLDYRTWALEDPKYIVKYKYFYNCLRCREVTDLSQCGNFEVSEPGKGGATDDSGIVDFQPVISQPEKQN